MEPRACGAKSGGGGPALRRFALHAGDELARRMDRMTTPLSASGRAQPRSPARVLMDRFIDTIEWVAAIFVGLVAANIFIAVLLRNLFSTAIPDAYQFGQFLLGILIFWGIAATSYRGTHITVDLVWSNVGPRMQRFIDVFATLVLLFVVTVQTYTLFDKVATTRADNVLTFELHLPVWPFYALAWAGDVSAVLLIAIRTYRLLFYPEDMRAGYQIKPVE
jgi:TRAP-type C4-dicarboxylate transport system permease small subunit